MQSGRNNQEPSEHRYTTQKAGSNNTKHRNLFLYVYDVPGGNSVMRVGAAG
jgi:hypothetical protein